jgi:type I restriction enzyme, S subunit
VINVPKLRFPEFEGEWEMEKARNIFFTISDKNHSGELPVISVTQNRGTIARQDLNIDIKYDKTNLINYKRIRLNNFVISLRSFQGGIDRSNHDGLVSPAYTIFDFIEPDRYNPHFFEHIFKSKNFINRLVTLIYGIRDGKAIGFTDFSSLTVSVPLKAEQTKIADFLGFIDKKITKQYEKVSALEQYKKGLMQKIFSREIRFKDDNGKDYPEWETVLLGDICNFFSGGTPAITVKHFYSGDIPFIKSADIHRSKTDSFISEEGLKNSSAKLIEKGDLIYALYGATSGEVDISKISGAINQAILCIRSEKLVLLYLKYLLEFKKDSIISKYLQGGQGNLSAEIIKSLKVDLPTLPEQTKIAKFLSLYDHKVEKEKTKREALREQKKGLLQQMFI